MKKYQPWIGLLSRLILGGVLLAAGLLKYQHLDKSQMAVRAYELLPVSLANILGIVLPFVEIAVGVLLVIGAGVRISALVGGVLMGAFMIGIAQAMTEAEIEAAAAYFSSIPWTRWITVVETATVPTTQIRGGMNLKREGTDAGVEAIGDRIGITRLPGRGQRAHRLLGVHLLLLPDGRSTMPRG